MISERASERRYENLGRGGPAHEECIVYRRYDREKDSISRLKQDRPSQGQARIEATEPLHTPNKTQPTNVLVEGDLGFFLGLGHGDAWSG